MWSNNASRLNSSPLAIPSVRHGQFSWFTSMPKTSKAKRRIDDTELSLEYSRRRPLFDRLCDEVVFFLQELLGKNKIPYHIITSRTKTFESFRDKIQRVEAGNPFEDIKDLCGIRIICLFLSDLERIKKLIEENLDILESEDKIQETPPEIFGYMAVHLIGKLPKHFSGTRYDTVKSIVFEIQARTITMDAWANISHYLEYKSPISVPTELRRDFYALSGLFYVADSHFEVFFKGQEAARHAVALKSRSPQGLASEEINLDTLVAFTNKRYANKRHSSPDVFSDLVKELVQFGYQSIAELEKDLDRSSQVFAIYEKDQPPHDAEKYADVGVVRASLAILHEEFARQRPLSEASIDKFRKYRERIK